MTILFFLIVTSNDAVAVFSKNSWQLLSHIQNGFENLGWSILRKNIFRGSLFTQKASSLMLDSILNTPLALLIIFAKDFILDVWLGSNLIGLLLTFKERQKLLKTYKGVIFIFKNFAAKTKK